MCSRCRTRQAGKPAEKSGQVRRTSSTNVLAVDRTGNASLRMSGWEGIFQGEGWKHEEGHEEDDSDDVED